MMKIYLTREPLEWKIDKTKGRELMSMKNFTIDFAGSCVIAAEDETAAMRTFWELINNQQPLPMNLYEVQNVEEET